jgi:hypothetical protein
VRQPNDSQGATGNGRHSDRTGLRGFQQAVGGKAQLHVALLGCAGGNIAVAGTHGGKATRGAGQSENEEKASDKNVCDGKFGGNPRDERLLTPQTPFGMTTRILLPKL